MKTLILLMVIVAPAATQAQQPPTPVPGCLSGPVTQGSLTVTCTDLNPTSYQAGLTAAAGDGGLYSSVLNRLFIVKAVTTDPGVVGVRIVVTTSLQGSTGQVGVVAIPAAQPSSSTAAYTYVFVLPASDISTNPPSPISVTSVTVQELKPSSSAAF
jgi:hypothetical protein